MLPPPSLLSRLSPASAPTTAPVSTVNEAPMSPSPRPSNNSDSSSARRTRGARKGEKDHSKKDSNGGESRKNSVAAGSSGNSGLIIEADGWIGVGTTRTSFSSQSGNNSNIPTGPLAMRLPQLTATNPFALPSGSSPNSYNSPPSSFTLLKNPLPKAPSLSSSPLKFTHLPALSPTRVQGSINKERDTTTSRWATTSPVAAVAPIVKEGFQIVGLEEGMKALSVSPSKVPLVPQSPSKSRWASRWASDEVAVEDQEEVVSKEKKSRGHESRASKKSRSPTITSALSISPPLNPLPSFTSSLPPAPSSTLLPSLLPSLIKSLTTPPSTITSLPPLSPSLRSPEPTHINWADDDDELDALPELDEDWMVPSSVPPVILPSFASTLNPPPPSINSSLPRSPRGFNKKAAAASPIKVTPIFNPKILARQTGPLSPTPTAHSTLHARPLSPPPSKNIPTSPRTAPAHLAMSSTARFGRGGGGESPRGGRGGGGNHPHNNSNSRGRGSSPAAGNGAGGGGTSGGRGGPTPDSFARLSGMSFRGARGGGRGGRGSSTGAGELVNGGGW